jgi:hypothetical protein
MSIETVRGMLLWSTIINFGGLALWVFLTLFAREALSRAGRWYGAPSETFNTVNYAGILLYKTGIILFNLVPYIALRIVAG